MDSAIHASGLFCLVDWTSSGMYAERLKRAYAAIKKGQLQGPGAGLLHWVVDGPACVAGSDRRRASISCRALMPSWTFGWEKTFGRGWLSSRPASRKSEPWILTGSLGPGFWPLMSKCGAKNRRYTDSRLDLLNTNRIEDRVKVLCGRDTSTNDQLPNGCDPLRAHSLRPERRKKDRIRRLVTK